MNQCNNPDIKSIHSDESRQYDYDEQVKESKQPQHHLQLKEHSEQNLSEKNILGQSKPQIKDKYMQSHFCTDLEVHKTISNHGTAMVNSVKFDDQQKYYPAYAAITNKDIKIGCQKYIFTYFNQNMIINKSKLFKKRQIKAKKQNSNNSIHDSKQNKRNFIKIISKNSTNSQMGYNSDTFLGHNHYMHNSVGCGQMQNKSNAYKYDTDQKVQRKARKRRLTITLKTTNQQPIQGQSIHNTLCMYHINTPINYLIKLQRQDPQEDEDLTLGYPCAQVKPYSACGRDYEHFYKFMI